MADAAHDDGKARVHVPPVSLDAVGDLQRKLACRRQDQRPRYTRTGLDVVLFEVLQKRQREGGRLAGACLGDAEQIGAVQQERYGLLLNRCGVSVLRFFKRT